MPLLEINNLRVDFKLTRTKIVHALKGVSLCVERGESVGLVGESGCGKSTLAAAVMRLLASQSGAISYGGLDVLALRGRELLEYRRRVQMVFQDPFGSLNPRLSIGSALSECLAVHRICPRAERGGRVAQLLETVGLDPAHAGRYPHEFSGGQRQRIGIARALALNPEFIIADEPVSALDVSIQAQILNLLKDLQEQKHFSFLFIAHDLAVVRYMCTRIYVMYLGEIMESGSVAEVYSRPVHPYTRALLDAVPDLDNPHSPDAGGNMGRVEEDEGSASSKDTGLCSFKPRCPFAGPVCEKEAPELKRLSAGHFCRCHFAGKGLTTPAQ